MSYLPASSITAMSSLAAAAPAPALRPSQVTIRAQNRFLVGSGLGLRLALLSSLPLALNHFLVLSSISRSSSSLGFLRWMKLQKPPRTHPSPEFSRQHASRKSVTGDSSQYMGRAAYQREFSASQAFCALSSYLNLAYTLPMRSGK